MHYMHRKNRKLHVIIAVLSCLFLTLLAIPLSRIVFAVPTTNIPVVNAALTTDTANPVVLINGSSQVGYPTLEAAMVAIGSNSGDYTIVFVQDYTMKPNTDMNATKANATDSNTSLSITSTFISDAPSSVQQTKIFKIQAGSTDAYNFYFNCDTTIHDCTFDVYGSSCSHMFGNCHNFTIGENVLVNNKGTNGRIQLYGGSDTNIGTAESHATTNLVINSGTFAYAMAGNRKGTFTGDAKITVRGDNTYITYLCPCSQTANCFGATSTSKVYVDGSQGAVCATIANYAATSLSATDTIDVYLTNTKSRDNTGKLNCATINLTQNNSSITNVYIDGDCQQCTQIAATNLIINDNSSLQNGNNFDGSKAGTETNFTGILTLKGNLTLGENSKYIHAGSGAQNITGDIITTGDNAEIQVYKQTATSAPVKMSVSGSYRNPDNKIDLSLWKDVAVANNDILLTFANAANANGESYNDYFSESDHGYYETANNGKNIIYLLIYEYPTYYKLTDIPHLYSYIEVGNSTNTDGGTHTVYRKYVKNTDTDEWEVYIADADGNYSGSPIDQLTERPQPNAEYRVPFEASKGTMIRLDAFGKYYINAAVGTNASGLSTAKASTGTACGNHISFYNIDDKGTNSLTTEYESNSSWADLKKTTDKSNIYKAYLVMTTPLRQNAGTAQESINSNIINYPMKLMYGDDVMLSNGYLPDGFIIGKTGTNTANLNTNTPTLIYDGFGTNTGLGEAMTITDVTDFVKAHGYGRYYGVDIPYEGADIDSTIAWRLIVLEEDPTMKSVRKVSLQMGPISNGNLTPEGEPVAVELDLDGLTTPDITGEDVFGGQLLMIGSDNTTDYNAGGGTGSNLHNSFCPNSKIDEKEFIEIASNDPNTIGVIDRPLGHWSQGLMDINGVNLTSEQVSHTESSGAMGIDMSLLSITNVENTNWEADGGHNIYLTRSSPAIMLTSKADPQTKIGYIDVLGLSTDVSLPKFETDIWHTDISTIPVAGKDIVAGEPVIIKGTAENVTPIASAVQGSFNTQVIVNIDKKLTNIRNTDDGTEIKAKFHNYDQTTETYNIEPITGVYDSDKNTLTFDFGSEFLSIPLYNTKGDWLELEFKADTDTTPTIDDDDVEYINNIGVWGQTIYQNNTIISTPYARYDYAEDRFETYINRLQISKTVTGDLADPDQEFSFTMKFSNSAGGHYLAGTEIDYIGGVLPGISAEAPADGKLTVNSDGEVTFKLKHGQCITVVGLLGSVEITEATKPEYTMSWENVLITADSKDITQNVGYDYTTGAVAIGENESRQINIYNNKTMIPSVGVSYSGTPITVYIMMVLLLIAGIALVFLKLKYKKKQY